MTDRVVRPDTLPRGLLILLGLAAATVAVAGMRAVSGILAPTVLALVLAIAADPLRSAVSRRGAPRWVGTLLVLAVVYVGLLALCASLLLAGARFATLVPQYQDELSELVNGLQPRLESLGIGSEQTDAILDSIDLSRVAGFVTALLSAVLSLASSLAFVLALVLFMCLDADAFRRHLGRVRSARTGFVTALESFATGTRSYLLVSTAFGLVVAVLDTALLYAVGVPGALLWGLLAFVTNYIPNIGFVLGLVPPALLALLEGGPDLMLVVIVLYSSINVLIQSVIQPKLVGDAVGISASVTFLSLVVWSWIMGPLGAVLAVPLTLLVKALLVDVDVDPGTRWVSGLIGAPLDDEEQPEVAGEADGGRHLAAGPGA